MIERESVIPMAVGLAVALLLHAALLPLVAGMADSAPSSQAVTDAGLAATDLAAPQTIAAGRPVDIPYEVTSTGTMPVVGQWRDVLLLSVDDRPDDTDLIVASRAQDRAVPAGELYADRFEQVVIPEQYHGAFHLVLVADRDGAVSRGGGSGQYLARPVVIESPLRPDLAIESIDAPEAAQADGSMLVRYTTTNRGEAVAPPRWSDRVYLSRDEVLDEDDLLLATIERSDLVGVNEGYEAATGEIHLPRRLNGAYTLFVKVDAGGALDEAGRDDNNVLSRPIRIDAQAKPDLQFKDVLVSDQLFIGRPASVLFVVVNRGNEPVMQTRWVDSVYVSDDDTLSEDDTLLASWGNDQFLAPRDMYRTPDGATITLPETVSAGTRYLIFHTDSQGTVDEGRYEDNNTRVVPIQAESKVMEPEVPLGSDDGQDDPTVAWISHDDYRKLIARQSKRKLEQPAQQSAQEPDPRAAMVRDPRPGQRGSQGRPGLPVDSGTPAAVAQADGGGRDGQSGSPSTSRDESGKGAQSPLDPDRKLPSDAVAQRTPQPDRPDPSDTGAPVDAARPTSPTASGGSPLPDSRDGQVAVAKLDDARMESPEDQHDGESESLAATSQRGVDPDSPDGEAPQVTLSETRVDEPGEDRPEVDDPREDAANTRPPQDDSQAQDKPEAGDAQSQQSDRSATSSDGEAPVEPGDGGTNPGDATSTPREGEVVPVSPLAPKQPVRPGKVITVKGLTIRTAFINLSAVVRQWDGLRNPVVYIQIDPETGRVVNHKMLKTSASKVADVEIEASLYRWRASGKHLAKYDKPFWIGPINILLRDE